MEKVKGGLVITLTEDNLVKIGEVKIYFHSIKVSGKDGGKQAARIRLIGPREVQIERLNR